MGISQSMSVKLCILLWDVRGINERDKCRVIKSLTLMHLKNLVCLKETKVNQMSVSLVRSLCGGRCLEWGAMDSRDQVGGVLVFWDNRVLQLIEMEVRAFFVSCWFKNNEDNFVWM